MNINAKLRSTLLYRLAWQKSLDRKGRNCYLRSDKTLMWVAIICEGRESYLARLRTGSARRFPDWYCELRNLRQQNIIASPYLNGVCLNIWFQELYLQSSYER